ncbi:MAG TPA: hypothetical protein DCM27_07245 [Rhodospirillaceae bacterium]|nr:hypothetical protein [Rhodospirillaceae bacterium]
MQIQMATFWIATSLSLLAMTSGAAMAAINIPFTINLSENVAVTGTPRIAVDVGGNTRYATYTSGTGTNALTFTLSPTVGDVDLDGVTLSSPIDLNGGTMKDSAGNDAALTFTPPNTSGIKVNYPSLGMDFTNGTTGRYTLNGTVYNDLSSFLTASSGSYTRASIGTYYDSTGTLQTASNNTPRFDYDPVTHAAKGILIEESKLNLILQSQKLGTTWSINNSGTTTITDNATTSPDSTTNASTISASVNAGGVYQVRTVTSGTTYTQSVYLKFISGSSTSIRIGNDISGFTGYIAINPQTMAITFQAANVLSSSISNIGNGWYRAVVSWTSTGTSASFTIYNNMASPIVFAAWGAQLEQGNFTTSYIPTTTLAITRAADNLVVGNSSAWLGNDIGALTLKARTFGARPAWGYAQLWDGTTTNRIAIINSGGVTGSVNTSGVNYATMGGPTPAGLLNAGISYAINNINLVYGGNTYTDTSAPIPVINQLKIGGSSTGTTELNGWMQAVKYYPLQPSNTQLGLMTQ